MNANSDWDSIPPSSLSELTGRPSWTAPDCEAGFDLYPELDLNWHYLAGDLPADTLRSNAKIFDTPPSGWPQTNYY